MKTSLVGLIVMAVTPVWCQSDPHIVNPVLERPLLSPDEVALQLRHYLFGKVSPLRIPESGAAWTMEAAVLRERVLRETIFHGWPREWVDAPLKAEDLGYIPPGDGYRIRKLRFEIVPGFYTSALLYEPAALKANMPAILNVNGHVGAPGKSVEYKQKRCINQARQGILSLNLEWIAFGELANGENLHWFGAHLDLAGANGVGLFYLAMRKGLDYLAALPNVDRGRIGMTGLSGGGWQTILLSSLDPRVAVAVPVAGFSALMSRIERPEDTGDLEQNPTDFYTVVDYPQLVAMRAPRPTLLIFNAEDDCCFRAPMVKLHVFDEVRPVFRLYGAEEKLAWHENTDPSTHNYQLDNRLQAYRFFAKYFGLGEVASEIPAGAEIKTAAELTVGLPKDNLTVLGLAKQFASRAHRSAAPSREKLAEIVRYRKVDVTHAWPVYNTKSKGVETTSYRFEFTNGLSAAGVALSAIGAPESAPVAIVLDDKGKKKAGEAVSDRVNRGERVLALDLLFTGDARPKSPGPADFSEMLAGAGDRPLGMEAAQLAAVARWFSGGARAAAIETRGMRGQVVSLIAAALDPRMFSSLTHREGLASLGELLDKPVAYQQAPDLFCLDLYKEFDIDSLTSMTK